MLFDTPVYFVFLIAVVSTYWLFARRQQNILLLLASYFFYGWWDWRFLSLILCSTVIDFFCARAVAASDDPRMRKALLAISVSVNLTFLGFFKYFNFFADSLSAVLDSAGLGVAMPVLRVILPPGISFYTFQELAYIVDVYKRKLEPADSLIDYALFITLFPHLIAGPIQRPAHLLPQVQRERRFDHAKVFDGILLILSGLFRETVVADNCALIANAAFHGQLGTPSLPVLALGAYAFAWQIYGDFSGYSDIARGSAQLMGFHFMVNFRQPYLAQSMQDFWRRWHISLSTWLRDYLYIPLGGNRCGERRTYANLMATMLLGGFWHGANWTFVLWGGIHGALLSANRFLSERFGRREDETDQGADLVSLVAWGRRIVVFHLVCLAWIFFRAVSLGDALHLLRGLTVWTWRPEYAIAFRFLATFVLPLFLVDLWLEQSQEEYVFEKRRSPLRFALASAFLVSLTLFAGSEPNAFIYFQF
jgi:D-alanyl-lipoteichoic acid acyltransferase DltB (MBOAT superfamily)